MQGTLGFTITGEYLTEFLRQFWVELEHKKILGILEGIPRIESSLNERSLFRNLQSS